MTKLQNTFVLVSMSGCDNYGAIAAPVLRLPLLADVTQHVRMNIQLNVRHVVIVLAGHQPDDLADLAFTEVAGQLGERGGGDLLFLR